MPGQWGPWLMKYEVPNSEGDRCRFRRNAISPTDFSFFSFPVLQLEKGSEMVRLLSLSRGMQS